MKFPVVRADVWKASKVNDRLKCASENNLAEEECILLLLEIRKTR